MDQIWKHATVSKSSSVRIFALFGCRYTIAVIEIVVLIVLIVWRLAISDEDDDINPGEVSCGRELVAFSSNLLLRWLLYHQNSLPM